MIVTECCDEHSYDKDQPCPKCGKVGSIELISDGKGHYLPGLRTCTNSDCPGKPKPFFD